LSMGILAYPAAMSILSGSDDSLTGFGPETIIGSNPRKGGTHGPGRASQRATFPKRFAGREIDDSKRRNFRFRGPRDRRRCHRPHRPRPPC